MLAPANGGAHLFEGEAARGIGAVGIVGGGGLLVQPILQRRFARAEGVEFGGCCICHRNIRNIFLLDYLVRIWDFNKVPRKSKGGNGVESVIRSAAECGINEYAGGNLG